MSEKENPTESLPKEGEVRVIDGVPKRFTNTGYTLRQYFMHETPEKGPGPGWDTRGQLTNNERFLRDFGQTFSVVEQISPELLPNIPYYVWEEVLEES